MWELAAQLIELLVVGIQDLRLRFREWQSRNWPTAPGTIQRCTVRRGYRGVACFLSSYRYRSVFGYSFRANESRYAGFFVLGAEDEGAADSLQKQAEGLNVTVRYNPENPDVSLLVDDEVQGRKISQNPHWFP